MANIKDRATKATHRISRIEITDERITGRAGLSLFGRYLDGIDIFGHLDRLFGGVRKHGKGAGVRGLFRQLFCFLLDGTSGHMVRFDQLREDKAYAGCLEMAPKDLASSHTVKRFLGGFYHFRYFTFRRLLQRLFTWRLRVEQPEVIVLGLDTMVMDNGDAKKRHGVKPTYKRVRGFQPLQLNWGRYPVDAVFRGGDRHSNHSDAVQKMLRHVVKRIRSDYREDVPILLRCDSGFFDQKIFAELDALDVGFMIAGRLYGDIGAYLSGVADTGMSRLEHGDTVWHYHEFQDERGSWEKSRRAIYCSSSLDGNGQYLFEFVRPDSIIYTNLGEGGKIDRLLQEAGCDDMLKAETIIRRYFGRGNDELFNRKLKDFASEKLPFKRFNRNATLYYTILTALFLMESFKYDVCPEKVVPLQCYPTTFRRMLVDIAGKIVTHAGQTVLKVTKAVSERIDILSMWDRCNSPPQFTWA